MIDLHSFQNGEQSVAEIRYAFESHSRLNDYCYILGGPQAYIRIKSILLILLI